MDLGGCQNYGPVWIPIIIRHLIFRVPEKDHHFDKSAFKKAAKFSTVGHVQPAGLVGF